MAEHLLQRIKLTISPIRMWAAEYESGAPSDLPHRSSAATVLCCSAAVYRLHRSEVGTYRQFDLHGKGTDVVFILHYLHVYQFNALGYVFCSRSLWRLIQGLPHHHGSRSHSSQLTLIDAIN